ncbi:MAG: hypothetical protein KatS3mg022_0326 [Armatimonadota bacterium]|nr:MAG: hypothetical protein KatS3mg022_0326 [Armatimonadota bacterium]
MQSTFFYPPLIAWAVLSLCLLLSPLQAQDLHITLLNGDCDGDNEVTLLDFGIVVNAFGSTPNDPNWDPRADLGGDCEVTLLDYGIVVRNFGAVGAEPFDPALPRQPAPSEGYRLHGMIRLEKWQGGEVTVRLEAYREDVPEQVVYYADYSVRSDGFFSLCLPDSGMWRIVAYTTSPQVQHFLTLSIPHYRQYQKGDPIQIIVSEPLGTELFSDFHSPIPITVHFFDYDAVSITSADGTVRLTNKEREKSLNLGVMWYVEGGGWIDQHAPGFADYYPEPLRPDEFSRTVRIVCTAYDRTSIPSRRDDAISVEITITLIKVPTTRAIVGHTVYHWHDGAGVESSLITSGFHPDDSVRFAWVVDAPAMLPWYLRYVEWLQVPWHGKLWGEPRGGLFDTFPISPDEEHRRVEVEVRATFASPYPDPWLGFQNTKTRSRAVTFALGRNDELEDFTRGYSAAGLWNPPNWFDNRPGHWGAVVPRFNEMDANLEDRYVVYYAPTPFMGLGDAAAVFDWKGEFALGSRRYQESWRGRIYLFGLNILAAHENAPTATKKPGYGLIASGIDWLATVVTHELAHRDLWLASWGGFDSTHIGQPPDWYPFDPDKPYDKDADGILDSWEEQHGWLGLSPNDRYSLERWWLYGENATGLEYCTTRDDEMFAQLFGEWNGHLVGSLDNQDWSAGGRQDY